MIAASLASTLSLALCAYLKCPWQAVERQIKKKSLNGNLLEFPKMAWDGDGILCGYWCRHRSKDC